MAMIIWGSSKDKREQEVIQIIVQTIKKKTVNE